MANYGFALKNTTRRGLVALAVAATQLLLSLSPLAPIAPASAATIDIGSSLIDFSAAKIVSAKSSSPTTLNGYQYYANVATISGIQIDAKITTVAITNSGIDSYDPASGSANGGDTFFQLNNTATAVDGKTSFKFEFFDAADNTPVTLRNVKVTSIDLDSPGRQFVEFSGFQSHVFARSTSTATKMTSYSTTSTGAFMPQHCRSRS